MKMRSALAILVYLLAFSLPAFGLYGVFGPDTRVDLDSTAQLLALAAAGLVTFVLATLAGVLLRDSDKPHWLDLIESFTREESANKSVDS
jgi:hypothetical protein